MNEPVTNERKHGKMDFYHEGFRVHVHVTSTVHEDGAKHYQAHRIDGTLIEGCDSTNEQDCIRAARTAIHEELKKA